jgi:hypothetical protein
MVFEANKQYGHSAVLTARSQKRERFTRLLLSSLLALSLSKGHAQTHSLL